MVGEEFASVVEETIGRPVDLETPLDLKIQARPVMPDPFAWAPSMVRESCFYCGSMGGPFHEDHVVPFSRGGSSLPRNLVLACAACNLDKRDRLPSEWRQDLNNRVYELEDRLVAWHQQVDERRRYSMQSIVKGCLIAFDGRISRVEVVDSRGIRIRSFEEQYVDTELSDPPLEPFSRWYAWSEVKRISIVDGDEVNAVRSIVQALPINDALRSSKEKLKQIEERVLALVACKPGQFTSVHQIYERIGGSRRAVLTCIRDLIDGELLIQPGGPGTPIALPIPPIPPPPPPRSPF